MEHPVNYSAKDSIVFLADKKIIRYYNEAEIDYDKINLKAYFIEINWEKSLLTAKHGLDSNGNKTGIPYLKEKDGQDIEGDEILYNFKTKEGIISNVTTQEAGGFLYGKKVEKNTKDELMLYNGWFTTCNLPDTMKHFHFNAKKIKVIPGKEAISGPVYMDIEGIPTPLALPFGFFPITTNGQSGIIPPKFQNSPSLGIGLQGGGYYFAISDHLDLALTGDIFSRGSYGLGVAINNVKRYQYAQSYSLNYSKQYFGDPDFLKLPSGTNTSILNLWKLIFNHRQDAKANPYSLFSASVDIGSSSYNRFNTQNAASIIQGTYSSNITWTKTFANNPIMINAGFEGRQNTQNNQISLTLPSVSLSSGRYQPLKRKIQLTQEKWYEKIAISYNVDFKNYVNTLDSILFTEQTFKRLDYGIKHNIPINNISFKLLKYITLTPNINLSANTYFKTIRKRYDADSAVVYTDTISEAKHLFNVSFSGSLTTKLYGFLQLKKGYLRALRSVFTPTVSYTFSPQINRNKNLSVQSDALGNRQEYAPHSIGWLGRPGNSVKSGVINFSLNTNIEAKVAGKKDTTLLDGLKKITLFDNINASTNYDLFRDSLKWSDVNLSVNTSLFKVLNINYNSSYSFYKTNGLGQPINQMYIGTNGSKITDFRTANLTFTTSLNRIRNTSKTKEGRQILINDAKRGLYVLDMDIPYNFNIGYNMSYNRLNLMNRYTHNINLSGNFELTSKWKVNANTYYDITNKNFGVATINLIRDLHCWEAVLNWIPVGPAKSYTLTIRIKSPNFQDVQIPALNRNWYDIK